MRTLLFILAMIVVPSFAYAGVLFETNFDNLPDWKISQDASNALTCKAGESCASTIPQGFYDYRVAATEACSNTDGDHNTLNINSVNHRGGSGKAFTMWNEPCLSRSGSWGSDGLLGVAFTPQSDVYVRYFIKFQPDWAWALGGGSSPMQKFLHISHADTSIANIWDFFSGTQNKPRFTPQLAKFGGGTYRTQFDLPHSPLTVARDNSASFSSDVYFGASPLDWNNTNAPGDGNWHSFEFHVKLNSGGGIADGVSQVWYDGALIHNKTDVVWVPTGDDPALWKWNHVWIGGNNSNLYTPTAEQWYAIDDVVVSTASIPDNYVIGSAVTPTTTRVFNGRLSGKIH